MLGQGYVGAPLAVTAAENGYRVVGFETDSARADLLDGGSSFVSDLDSSRLQAVLADGTYRVSTDVEDLAGFDIAVITVPTPLRESSPDLSFIESASEMVASHLRVGALVVLESTSYPGTTEDVVAPILRRVSGLEPGVDFDLGFSPERIDPGNRTWRLKNTPKIVSGINDRSSTRVHDFYGELLDSVVMASNPRVAELAKLFENTFRQVNIALANEMAVHAHSLDIDIWETLRLASTKPFGFMRFSPGPGVGGHCLPIDPLYLAWQVEKKSGSKFRMVELADEINRAMPEFVVQRVRDALARRDVDIAGSTIVVLGLAYKANSTDVRTSPALDICSRLIDMGATVSYVDRQLDEQPRIEKLTAAELTEERLRDSDAVIIVADHDHVDYEFVRTHAPFVFDCRRRLVPSDRVELL